LLEALKKLVEIQAIDTQLAAVEKEEATIPELRASAEQARDRAREELVSAEAALEDAELEERRLEGELRDNEALLDRLDAQTYEVKSTEAYRTLQSEIEHARQAISDGETRILETMERIDETRAELDAAQQREVETRGAGEEEIAKLEERVGNELARLRDLRAECAAAIQADALLQYERIAERRSPALRVVSGKACPSCRMAIQPQKAVEIGAAHAVVTCDSCGRILVSQRALEEQPGDSKPPG
jgi:predicted  nucleic acid-binding Zn-ribbon protein